LLLLANSNIINNSNGITINISNILYVIVIFILRSISKTSNNTNSKTNSNSNK